MYVLEDVWFGNFTPSERQMRKVSKYQKIAKRNISLLDAVKSELSPEGKKTFDDFCATEMELGSISERDAFYLGVRFGAGFMLDVMGEYNSDLPQI